MEYNYSSNAKSIEDADIEKNPIMVKFLAQIRKSGMDILFPQIAHDKVRFLILSLFLRLQRLF